MDISVVVPFYNEEESLTELNDWIYKVMESNHFSFEIIYIDDGSNDGSWNIVKGLSVNYASVKALRFRRNYGKSAALNEGFAIANGKVVITMDSDLQDSPDEIPGLYNMLIENDLDIVSGWKRKRYDSTLAKNIPSKIFNWTSRKLFKSNLHDMNCGLKAYKNEVVKNIEVYGEMHRYIPIIAKAAGFSKIDEKVVVHQKRKYGVTKFGLDRFVKGYLDLISINFVSRFSQRPMHFFGSMGSVLFLFGFLTASYLAYAKFFMDGYRMTERPLFYFGLLTMILGVMLFLTGFLAEMISRTSGNKSKYQIKERINIKEES
ncbi:MAG: glycosyltransferase family 2 protein [Lentimicrobiaceae bacterium]|jgi:glycosyltransferase involved in cell wall biosynthesis|nr:glycosyltransferase family 2 protein [Lentimicrobiaceae bacterium]MCP4909748.1 glycosyltransferase family 2 protein [Bacteroidota bacterium]MBT3455260.1 glycosyltransferase family 2 protein [Lentimicrobiaceae bacterium]MBT3817874.1 glycosyltransferase family 2 protein [Lentimicrobiaceae bacterium]MBT4060679.1 glycosyltransferase family 2 protein [Lentimicrobiaceae bacterium]